MRTGAAGFLVGLLLTAGPPPAAAQTADPQIKVINVDSTAYPDITAVVSVPMVLSGRSLRADNFDVRERDDSRPVKVTAFDPSQLQLAIVVDSAMTGTAFVGAQGALLELPVHLRGPNVSIVRAATPATVALPPTRDPAAASVAVRGLTPSNGESNIEDGIAVAFDQFVPDGSRRAILLVTSDVEVDAGRIARTTDRAVREGVVVYVISLSPFVADEVMALANVTGGAAWAVEPLDIVPTIDRMVAELRGQYQVTARLTGADPSAPVTVVVTAGGVTARSRLRFAIPIEIALRAAPAERPAPEPSAGLPWPLLVAGAVGLLVFAAGVISVRSAVFHRSQERLEAG
ncbi:MAG: VWA domain-containing protein [Acidimicrobiales bacterium]